MYAIIRDRSKQTTVREGDEILVDLGDEFQPGSKVTFDEVLLVGNEGSIQVGKPTVAGASVTGEVLALHKGPKLVAFRFKKRKNVRVKRGHRQKHMRVRIESIQA